MAGEGSGNSNYHLEKYSLLQAVVHVDGEGSGMFYFHWIMFITSAAELGRPSGERALYEIVSKDLEIVSSMASLWLIWFKC